MTREEERKQRAEEIFDLPQSQAIFMCGAQWADKTMIEKAVEWFDSIMYYVSKEDKRLVCDFTDFDRLVNDFKKAMMEE